MAFLVVQVSVKEGKDFLLKKGTSKDDQGFGPHQNKPFRGPHNKKRGSYKKRPCGGNSSQSSNQSFFSNMAPRVVFDPTLGGEHLEQTSTKGLWSDRQKRLHINRVEGGFSGPTMFQGPVTKPKSVGWNRQLNSSGLHKQGGTHSAEMCARLWKIMTWCHHYQITLKARHIPGCLNVMADLLSRSNQVVHPSCRSIGHSSEPQNFTVRVSSPRPKCLGHRCSKHKLVRSHCLCLPSDGSPSQGDPKNQAMQLPDHYNSPRLARESLVLGPSAALNRDPTSATSVNNSFKQSHKYVFHSNPQHLNLQASWCLGVDSSKYKASLWRWQSVLLPLKGHQQGPFTSQSGPYLRNGAEKIIWWMSPLPL